MSFERPSLAALIARFSADIEGRTDGSAFLRRSLEGILSRAVPALTSGLWGYLGWILEQCNPMTAELQWLIPWGAVWGLTPKSATSSTGQVRFAATNGTVVPAGASLTRGDAVRYTVDEDAVASSGGVTLQVTAVEATETGNADPGVRMRLASAPAGLNNETGVVLAPGLSGGAVAETASQFMHRVRHAIATPARGGGDGDYVTWALEVPGVTRAWERPKRMGVGTVAVAVVSDNAPDPIPSNALLADVQTALDLERPADMRAVFVLRPVRWSPSMTIKLDPNTTPVQDAVKAELAALFEREADLETPIVESHLREAVSGAVGEYRHKFTSLDSLDPGVWGLPIFDPSRVVFTDYAEG